ncbi:unnamed protein product [Acanthoscelides obtectus]|uniref:Uncharacterized protein n=1 Tax=Acanthoscelides obtectus TaxID=200917 RepID=A0A9P0KUM5_ACAOB|nr:unnamed protein product [Acanthoscelides obtectus]CAK1642722.1 hypothetical protein AOBTE_LOCUS13182 [Acanthoscelides obtectus]
MVRQYYPNNIIAHKTEYMSRFIHETIGMRTGQTDAVRCFLARHVFEECFRVQDFPGNIKKELQPLMYVLLTDGPFITSLCAKRQQLCRRC